MNKPFLLLTICLLTYTTVYAQVTGKITDFQSHITVNSDYTLEIKERVELDAASFESKEYHRYFPLVGAHTEGGLENYDYLIEQVSCEGKEVGYTEETKSDHKIIRIPLAPVTGKNNACQIQYRVAGLGGNHGEFDVLNYPLTIALWNVQIQKARIITGFTKGLRASDVRGSLQVVNGVQARNIVGGSVKEDNTIEIRLADSIGEGDEIRILLHMPRGYLDETYRVNKDINLQAPKWRGGRIENSDPKEVNDLIAVISDPTKGEKEKQSAIFRLADLKTVPTDALIPLLTELNSQSERVRTIALFTLIRMRLSAVDAVLDWYKRGQFKYPHLAITILGYAGPSAADKVMPVFMEALQGTDLMNRSTAVSAISFLGPKAEGAIPVLKELFRDPQLKLNVTFALGDTRSALAAPPLLVALADPTADVAQVALQGLLKLDEIPADVRPFVLDILKNPSSADSLKSGAARIAGRMKLEEATDALIECSRSTDLYLHTTAARALENLSSDKARTALDEYINKRLPELNIKLLSEDEKERCATANALGALGPLAQKSIVTLLEVIKKYSYYGTCQNVIYTLGQTKSDDENVLKALDDSFSRTELVVPAAGALATIGTPKARAVLRDHVNTWRNPVIESLRTGQDRMLIPSLKALSTLDEGEARLHTEAWGDFFQHQSPW